ncbi:hypothetical protein PMW_188 [Pseudomonas phage phiPMW]|uniref:Uncharacterized protein n=1 Tax=Pseudomonas phage phiPMW TaxID=1815582 RepID=A0A1S5R1M9_9CAUD|nr:hypothetical protein FDG97_gp162 [Pseudomonas phage phiPMW]ANA49313.1 hypothetical protein PMW_188 [Pseudomonas phage phiPMW]
MKRLIGVALAAIIGVQSAHALERDPVTGIPVIGLKMCEEQKTLAIHAMTMRQAEFTKGHAQRNMPSGRLSQAILDLMYRSEVGSTKEHQIDLIIEAGDTVHAACIKAAKQTDMKMNGV